MHHLFDKIQYIFTLKQGKHMCGSDTQWLQNLRYRILRHIKGSQKFCRVLRSSNRFLKFKCEGMRRSFSYENKLQCNYVSGCSDFIRSCIGNRILYVCVLIEIYFSINVYRMFIVCTFVDIFTLKSTHYEQVSVEENRITY